LAKKTYEKSKHMLVVNGKLKWLKRSTTTLVVNGKGP